MAIGISDLFNPFSDLTPEERELLAAGLTALAEKRIAENPDADIAPIGTLQQKVIRANKRG